MSDLTNVFGPENGHSVALCGTAAGQSEGRSGAATPLSPEQFVSSLDLKRAAKRFRECLRSGRTPTREASDAADRYTALEAGWTDDSGSSEEAWAATQPDRLEVYELEGVIKWYDASRGYGFIVPDNGLADVLLHVTCLRAGGYPTAREGARVNFQAIQRRNGLQAFRILSMDESTAIAPTSLPARGPAGVAAESGWERAMVKWFNRVRGFAFLTQGEGHPDIFCHIEVLRRFGFTELRPGQMVYVRWGKGTHGRMAAELRPDGCPLPRPSH